MAAGHDRSSTVLLALSRPAVLWGCPLEGVALNVLGTFFAGIWLSGPSIYRSPIMIWLVGIPIHLAMQRLTAYDYYWVRTARIWLMTQGAGHGTLESLPTRRPRSGKECPSSV